MSQADGVPREATRPRRATHRRPTASRLRRTRWLLLAAAGLLVVVVALDHLVDEPLRASIERRTNERLVGYAVVLDAADWKPWNFSVALDDLVVRQTANPEPAVLDFPRFACTVQWRTLLRLRLVGDCELDRPRLHLDLGKLRHERRDDVALEDRGWQDALREVYPLEINEFRVHDGTVTYIGDDPEHPLQLTRLQALVRNIRNVVAPEETYPSSIEASARVFDTAPTRLRGRADFLAEPHAAMRGDFRFVQVPLDRLQPIVESYQLVVRGGAVSAAGEVEYTADRRRVEMSEVEIAGIRIDYVSDPELTARAVQAVTEAKEEPELIVEIGTLRLVDSEIGFVSRARDPHYRVFVTDADLTLSSWTNQHDAPPSRFDADGLFMGSGETAVRGLFRPDRSGADFDLAVAIRGTRLESMNDLLRAYANVDVADGTFSFFSELRIAEGRIDGYVKPLFQDVDVYDREQDQGGGFFHNLWERIAGGLARLLENRSRDEVATVADLSGSVSDPGASNLQVVLNLVENAFIEAILPGFLDRARRGGEKERKSKDTASKNQDE